MGVLVNIVDRLTNVMSGMGTTADRRTSSGYVMSLISAQQAEAAYRSSWLVRKIVDVPPLDMTRAWRDWQAEGTDIEKIEAEEKRLALKAKCKRALILSRLYGGGALILGTKDEDPTQPLNTAKTGVGGLTYVHVMSRYQLSLGPAITDPGNEWFGKPEYFEIRNTGGANVRLHPSRVIEFVGQPAPEGAMHQMVDWFWGDPIMQSIGEAVKNADLAQSGFAALIDEAKLDILKIPNMMANIGTAEYESRLLARLAAAAQGKSTWRALMIDGDEEWDQKQITWTGIPAVMDSFLLIVAGAADIPMTRLLGQSPKGLQSTGDGEERDYQSMITARQDELLIPALNRIDQLLIPSALGSHPTDVYYEMAPLAQMNPTEAAAIEVQYANIAKTYSDAALVPDVVLSKIIRNGIIERGQFPGSETAFEEAEAAGLDEPADPNAADDLVPSNVIKIESMRKKGAITGDQATMLVADASPRSLYVSRKLLNASDLIAWAKSQGFGPTLPAAEMHVTVLYSRTPVDWMAMGTGWDQDAKGHLTVLPGGARIVQPLGDKGAVVLLFASSALSWRHDDMVSKGASHDFDEYQPHVTITYAAPADLDLTKVEPYQGELRFGPEIFAEVDEDWTPSTMGPPTEDA
jgi:phage-related protein (TIGR01555 family)